MNVSCLKDDLQKALLLTERHTSNEDNIPLLRGVLLEVKDDMLSIRATNLDTGFEISIPSKVKKRGVGVVPVKTLSSLLSTFSEEHIRLEIKHNNLIITTPSTSTTVKGYPYDDFPLFPKLKKTTTLSLSSDTLVRDLLSVVVAASLSEMKPEISSVLFYIQKNAIKFVATDSFRLAEKTIPFKYTSHHSLLFPYRHIIELIKIIDVFPSNLSLSFDSSQALFKGDNFLYITRLRDVSFPSYEQIIPSSFSTEATVKKSDLLKAVKGASIFSGRLREVGFSVYPEDGLFEVVTKNSDVGEHVSQISAKITGERLTANFNYTYIIDGLNHISSDDVILRFNGEAKPVLIQNPYDAGYIYLAMPMKNI